MGKAVVRNRAKRLLRAAFFSISNELKDGTYIMVAKNGITEILFDKICKNLSWSIKKMGCLKWKNMRLNLSLFIKNIFPYFCQKAVATIRLAHNMPFGNFKQTAFSLLFLQHSCEF